MEMSTKQVELLFYTNNIIIAERVNLMIEYMHRDYIELWKMHDLRKSLSFRLICISHSATPTVSSRGMLPSDLSINIKIAMEI